MVQATANSPSQDVSSRECTWCPAGVLLESYHVGFQHPQNDSPKANGVDGVELDRAPHDAADICCTLADLHRGPAALFHGISVLSQPQLCALVVVPSVILSICTSQGSLVLEDCTAVHIPHGSYHPDLLEVI